MPTGTARRFLVSFGVITLMACMQIHAQTSNTSTPTLELFQSDARYNALERLVTDAGYSVDGNRITVKNDSRGNGVVIPVIDDKQETKGVVSFADKVWRLSLEVDDLIKMYEAVRDKNGAVEIIEREKVPTGGIKPMIFDTGEKLSIQPVSMTGSNWCQYTSKVGLNFGCFDKDDNPFAYYSTQTYRQGATITWNQQAWFADYKGRQVICPVKELSWSPFKWVECGFPPD